MFSVANRYFCSVQTDSERQITKKFPLNLKAASLEDSSLPFQLELTAAFATRLRIAAQRRAWLYCHIKSASQHFTVITAAAPQCLQYLALQFRGTVLPFASIYTQHSHVTAYKKCSYTHAQTEAAAGTLMLSSHHTSFTLFFFFLSPPGSPPKTRQEPKITGNCRCLPVSVGTLPVNCSNMRDEEIKILLLPQLLEPSLVTHLFVWLRFRYKQMYC